MDESSARECLYAAANEDVSRFQRMLIDGGITTYIRRRPRGRDVYAACGQLERTVSEERGELVVIGAAAV